MSRSLRDSKIYTTHGQKKLLAVSVSVDGQRGLGFVKEHDSTAELLGFAPWDEVCKKVYSDDNIKFDNIIID